MRNADRKPIVTVVIATYKRPRLLYRCLLGLMRQSVAISWYEVVVVDDDPKLSAKETVNQLKQKWPRLTLKYVAWGKQQNARARNEGVRLARGKWLAFIDDDAIPSDTWIQTIIAVINKFKSVVSGGPIYPYYDQKKPRWFKDLYEIRSYGIESRVLTSGEFLSASNLVVEKKVFNEVGGFQTNLGISGNRRGYGEEVKLQEMIRSVYGAGSVFYEPNLEIVHLVPANKMDLWKISKARFAAGMYHENIYDDDINLVRTTIKAGVAGIRVVVKVIWWVVKRPSGYKYFENYWIERVANSFYEVGWFWSKIRSPSL